MANSVEKLGLRGGAGTAAKFDLIEWPLLNATRSGDGLGFTYNWENTHTNYKNGNDSHVDWAVSQFLSENWELGVAGYLYYQLTGDSGSGNRVGAFKSRVASFGPELGYVFQLGGQPAYFNLRGYWEFWAQNRVEGYALYATLSVPLGRASK